MLAQVYIEHKGYKVKVGSGFSQEQRIKYLTEDIVGKKISNPTSLIESIKFFYNINN